MQRFYEEYLPPYEACIKSGARAIMPAFNDINGVPSTVNQWLLTDVLRNQWAFDGLTVSDANAIDECVNHGVAINRTDAARQALIAGLDMDMSSNCYIENLKELITSNQIDEERLNHAVSNVLRIKFELGLFENPYQTSEARETRELLKPEYRNLAREAAQKSMVLLKNDGILPLKTGRKLGIVGELAANRSEMTGAWAIGAKAEDCVSIVDASKLQNQEFTYISGLIFDEEAKKFVLHEEELLQLADCDVIIVAIGEKKDQSGEAASRADITIPDEQIQLLLALKAMNKPVVAVVFNGRPLAMPWVAEEIPAILEAWHPGVEAGNAILDLLFGTVNPSGKLTTTFPYSSGQCPSYYGHINTGRPGGKGKFTSKYLDTPLEPVYPFGYGLSYTTYQYSNLTLSKEKHSLVASVTVQNTGERDGEEIVQCYIRDIVAQSTRPVKKLVDFEKVAIKAGESKKVTFEIEYHKLGYYDREMNYIVEQGEFEIFLGKNSVGGLWQSIMY
jgi:beta-glucosidase